MKKIFVAALLVLTLAGCGQTTADVVHDGHFAKVCHANGGRVTYMSGDGSIKCDFADR